MRYVGTTTPLTGGSTFTSGDRMSNTDDSIVGTVFSDQGGTLHVEQGYPDSAGAVHYDVDLTTPITVTANEGQGFSVGIVAPKWRLRYVNGATLQGTFRLNARSTSTGDS